MIFATSTPSRYPSLTAYSDNPMSATKVELGRHLFYDVRLSGNAAYACAVGPGDGNYNTAGNYQCQGFCDGAGTCDQAASLRALPQGASAEDIQSLVYEAGKAHEFENLRDWFRALYETLLGQSQGPRMGGFIALYGVDETLALIDTVLDGRQVG